MSDIALIAAVARNGVIGREGGLPWRLPDDLKSFKALTMGKPIIMGRKTHASIGRALPGRVNIVLSRDHAYQAPGCHVVRSRDEALAVASRTAPREIMIIGGAAIYALFLGMADRLYLTLVDAEVAGDVDFPDWDPRNWRVTSKVEHPADGRHKYAFTLLTLTRRASSQVSGPKSTRRGDDDFGAVSTQ